jgi:hypothetical protein
MRVPRMTFIVCCDPPVMAVHRKGEMDLFGTFSTASSGFFTALPVFVVGGGETKCGMKKKRKSNY